MSLVDLCVCSPVKLAAPVPGTKIRGADFTGLQLLIDPKLGGTTERHF